MNNSFIHELKRMRDDNTSGSKDLLDKLHSLMKNNQDIISLDILNELRNNFQSFQSIQSYLDKLTNAYITGSVESFLKAFDKSDGLLFDKLFEKFKLETGDKNCFLTISNSLTLFEIFTRYKKLNDSLRVIISEGRPNKEGRFLAEKLSSHNIDITIVTEAQTFQYINNADAVLIGADKILSNGNVINKVGSNNLAVLAKHFNIPFYIVADSSKVSKTNDFVEEEKNSHEIWNKKPAQIKVVNNYFEQVDKKLITKIITD